MATWAEANRVRAGLKLRLSNYAWVKGTNVLQVRGDYVIVVHTSRLDNTVRKTVPTVVDGIEIRTDAG